MRFRKWICVMLALLLLAAILPQPEVQAYAAQTAFLTFSDGGIAETVHGAGYVISGTTLTLTAAGTYRLTGRCAEGSVVVGKGLSGVTLILDDLTLSSAVTAPVVVKKGSSVLLKLEGESTLTDNEDAATEAANADFEGACIKVKSGSSLAVFGDGTLNIAGNAKNGIKGAALSTLMVDGGTIIAQTVNHGISFDGSVTVNGGSLDLTAGGDGLKSDPDDTDTESPGTVTIRGGAIKIHAQSDGIQAKTDLTITGGSFDIRTMDGYQSRSFNSSTMSCKGLKASGTETAANHLTISGGTFVLNTADDAIHSDGDVTITAGTFEIYTGDDGVHADSTLTLGTENGYERDPEITIPASYEGLEGGTICGYSGKYHVVASDDGMNAAGGSSNGSDPGGGGGNHFNPGGGWGPGGGWNPGGPGTGGTGDYSMNFYGGSWYIDCKGDGLDSNGDLNLYGGAFTVLSMAAGGDNSPLDADGTMLVRGATVFGAGSAGMNERPSSASQNYYTDSTRRAAGTVVNVSCSGSVVYSETLVRNISYLFYSSPEMTGTECTVAAAAAVSTHLSNAWAHDWDEGTVETPATAEAPGMMVYTCACGARERKTIDRICTPTAYEQESDPCSHDYRAAVIPPTCTEAGYTTYTCARCGDSYKAEETAALGHDYEAVVTAPTCTEPGFTTYTCSRCSDSYVDGETAALGHDWDEGKVTVEPTGTEPGVRTFTCARCAQTKTEAIPAPGHEHSYRAAVTAPTCTEPGYTTFTCACGDSYKAEETAALGHDYEAVVTAPTCTEPGFTTYTCSRCFDSYVDGETAALGHDFVDGVCARCGAKNPDDVPVVSKDGLSRAIEDAGAVDPEKYTDGSVEALNKALEEARKVLARDDASQDEVDDAARAVRDAIDALEEKPVDTPFRFEDVRDGSKFYFAPVYWAYEARPQITNGIDDTHFGPDHSCTRAHVVTFLWRAAGCPAPEKAETTFTDLKPGAFYETAVAWAVENGVTNGMTETTFAPDGICTRGQIVTFLWRFRGEQAPKSITTPFTDLKSGAFYETAVAWAVENGVTNGMTETTFVPDGICTRGQVVTFLCRAAEEKQ